ncbi:MAG: ABC transporter permease, partial [Actinomycetes bacterium]
SALVALYGRIYDPASAGAISMIKLGGFGSVCVALLTVFLVVRHTRADEESGRAELLGATAIGRLAPLASALTVATVTSVVLGATTALLLATSGLPADGSIAFGVAWAGAGLCFASVAGVAAQCATTARGASAICWVALAVVYALRALGDAATMGGPRWLSWGSPIGWAQQFRPYAGNRWWVAGIVLAFTLAIGAAAFVAAARRDLGAGLIAPPAGPPAASASLRSTGGLAWRLHRGGVLAWAVSFVMLGALVGGIASDVRSFTESPNAQDFIRALGGEQGLIDAFLAVEMRFAGIVAAAFGVAAVLRLRTEELEGRAVPLLAAPVGRTRWATSHLGVALVGCGGLLILAGAGAGTVRSAQTGDLGQLGRLVVAATAQFPAAAVLIAATALLYGLGPRIAAAAWAFFAACILLGEFGPLLKLPQRVLDVSPFTHAPQLPGGATSVAATVWMVAASVLMIAAGGIALRRRDIG